MVIIENEDICLTLDEYIKRKKANGSLAFLDYRKKEKNIDKDQLDAGLEEIAQARSKKSTKSKFERYNNDSDSDSEDDGKNEKDTDVQMKDVSDENGLKIENSSIRFYDKMQHPECCQIKRRFQTVEQELGVKVKSQQWRVQNGENSSCSDDNVNKIKGGRVQKGYKKPTNSKAGIFIEKGNFTYKFADNPNNNNDDNAESIIGIVRNKPITKIVNGNRSYQQSSNAPVNINMNFKGLFKEMAQCMETFASTPKARPLFENKFVDHKNVLEDVQVKVAASELFEYLLTKREMEKKSNNHQNDMNNDSKMSNALKDYIISARSGDGIEMDVTPVSTNLPLNLRFA